MKKSGRKTCVIAEKAVLLHRDSKTSWEAFPGLHLQAEERIMAGSPPQPMKTEKRTGTRPSKPYCRAPREEREPKAGKPANHSKRNAELFHPFRARVRHADDDRARALFRVMPSLRGWGCHGIPGGYWPTKTRKGRHDSTSPSCPARPKTRKTGGAVAVVAVVAVILKPITATVDSSTQESASILLGRAPEA